MTRPLIAIGMAIALCLGLASAVQARELDTRPAGDAPPAAPSGCGSAATKGLTLGTLTSGGVKRSYRLYVPANYVATNATPLVLNLHGYSSNAREQEAYSKMPAAAEANGFITVAPDGTNNPRRWYIYGKLEKGYVDDYAFVTALIDDLSSKLCIDAKRVFATGISNGGAFSAIMACKLNDRIAAVVPVAGEPFPNLDCIGKNPVPIMAFHGTADELVPFEGGPSGRLGLPAQPVRTNMYNWAKFNGCNLTLQSERIASDVVLESYGGCRNGADVKLYVVEGGGHTWPGAVNTPWLGATTHSINATSLAWQFFAAHPKP